MFIPAPPQSWLVEHGHGRAFAGPLIGWHLEPGQLYGEPLTLDGSEVTAARSGGQVILGPTTAEELRVILARDGSAIQIDASYGSDHLDAALNNNNSDY